MLKSLSWQELHDLHLIEKINQEYLHPRGLALSWEPDTNTSKCVLVSDDGTFEYDHPREVPTDDELKSIINKLNESNNDS